MNCPFCGSPLEALVIQGRHTGAYQCLNCLGSWLSYKHLGGLLDGGAKASTALVPAGQHAMVSGGFSHIEPTSSSPWSDDSASQWEYRPGGDGFSESLAAQGKGSEGTRVKRFWWKRKKNKDPEETKQDWDLCTYCGKPHPGDGATCVHCNVERMICPQCGSHMTGVRRFSVLVDLCPSCQGLFFEKGRLETLLDQMKGRTRDGSAVLEGSRERSLLQQLAEFLEDTEPGELALSSEEPRGVLQTVTSAVGSGLGGSRRVLYDFLLMLGEIRSPKDERR